MTKLLRTGTYYRDHFAGAAHTFEGVSDPGNLLSPDSLTPPDIFDVHSRIGLSAYLAQPIQHMTPLAGAGTSFKLSSATISAIKYAINNGPGMNNVNYVTAYTDISKDIQTNGGATSGTHYWFSQAGQVNGQQFSATLAGTYIWAYTQSAAASEGAAVTVPQLQAASNSKRSVGAAKRNPRLAHAQP